MLIGFGLWFIVALVQGLAVIVDPAATVGPAIFSAVTGQRGCARG